MVNELIPFLHTQGDYFMSHKNLKDLEVPSVSDWEKVISNIPVENVVLKKDGRIDPQKSPDFYDWIING